MNMAGAKLLGGIMSAVLLTVVTLGVPSRAETAHAGSNGQQLQFYNYSGRSSIAWLRVDGTNHYGNRVAWSRSFSPSVSNFSLGGWWWKGSTYVQWRMADGRTGSCSFTIQPSHSRDWNQVGVDRNGSSCWFS
jgi:hypothetical protein